MKLLSVNATLDPVAGGGTAERTYQMARFLAQSGMECTVLTLDIGLSPERVSGLHPASACVLHCVLPRFYLFRIPEPRIAELVHNADIIHLMGHWTLLNVLVAREASRQQKPYVVCPAGALPIYGRSRCIKRIYNSLAGQRLISNARACVAVASNEIDQFANYGISTDRITLIPNGIDPVDFESVDNASFRRRFSLPPNPFVLFLGRLNNIKGPDLLLEAFLSVASAHPDMHLVFAGPDGGMLASLRATISATPIAHRTHFIGPVRGTEKSQACHAATLLAIPSRHEAMSIVALEAGICGTPVLITDRCGFDEITTSGGAMIVTASARGLSEGLHALLGKREQLPSMGAALLRFTLDHYLWRNVAGQYKELFSRTLIESA